MPRVSSHAKLAIVPFFGDESNQSIIQCQKELLASLIHSLILVFLIIN